jgi:histidinol-phosphate/aromatic aminotransferase/cobyric acid decarboxylase-like protein
MMRATHGGTPGARLDFSTCVNAYGPAPVVLEAIRSADVVAYPDRWSRAARGAASQVWDRPIEEIVLGAGSAELIAAAVTALVRPGDTVLVPRPAFGEYGRAAVMAGARVVRPARLAIDATGTVIADGMIEAIRAHRPWLTFLAAPTSPVGTALGRDAVRAVADACQASKGFLILDQAYDAFSAEPLGTPALVGHGAVLHLRSLTKDHALAGVRVGFAIGPAGVIAAIEGVRVPWAASSVSQAAAVAALSDEAQAHVARSVMRLRAEAGRWGLANVPSATHYCLLPVRADCIAQADIAVRDCRSFGLPSYIRVAARTPPENAALRAALGARHV